MKFDVNFVRPFRGTVFFVEKRKFIFERQKFYVNIELYDTTLRDGAQYEGISFSAGDKITVAKSLDELGVHYIEGGWPGSNPKDAEFFELAKTVDFQNSTLVAFGSTRRADMNVADDPQINSLLSADTTVVTLVGKAWDLHVTEVLETSLEENLAMISDSVSYLVEKGKRVFFDAEHFFDGYRNNPEYAVRVLEEASMSGAECVILCDTNGGFIPSDISEVVKRVNSFVDVRFGIHTHNDADMAVAGSLAAIDAGVTQVQGTINGYGERCGNANLVSVIANLKLKKGVDCISDKQLGTLTEVSRIVAEIANMPPPSGLPFVGATAFAHKGGIHASAVAKVEQSYQHIPPEVVGNTNRILVSELSGRSNIIMKTQERMGVTLDKSQARLLLEEVKEKENQGFQYEGAEASFELLVTRLLPGYRPAFSLVDFVTVVERRINSENDKPTSQVMLKVSVKGEELHTAADGNGPVNALDHALRKALLNFYPDLEIVRLIDYKVRVVEQHTGTGAIVRVLLESTDGDMTWTTVGSSENVIEASWMALSDSMEWWLARH